MFWVTFVLFFPNQRHPKAQGTFITVLGYPLEELSVPSWLLPEGDAAFGARDSPGMAQGHSVRFCWVAADSSCSLVRKRVRFGCSCPESAPHLVKRPSSVRASTPGAAGKAQGATGGDSGSGALTAARHCQGCEPSGTQRGPILCSCVPNLPQAAGTLSGAAESPFPKGQALGPSLVSPEPFHRTNRSF